MRVAASLVRVWLLIAVAAAFSQVAQAAPPKKYALLAAVAKYEHAGLSKLLYPEVDAKELGEVFTSR